MTGDFYRFNVQDLVIRCFRCNYILFGADGWGLVEALNGSKGEKVITLYCNPCKERRNNENQN